MSKRVKDVLFSDPPGIVKPHRKNEIWWLSDLETWLVGGHGPSKQMSRSRRYAFHGHQPHYSSRVHVQGSKGNVPEVPLSSTIVLLIFQSL